MSGYWRLQPVQYFPLSLSFFGFSNEKTPWILTSYLVFTSSWLSNAILLEQQTVHMAGSLEPLLLTLDRVGLWDELVSQLSWSNLLGISQDKLNCQTCEWAVWGKTGEKILRHVQILFSLNGYLCQLRLDHHTNRLDVGGAGFFFLSDLDHSWF
jgi:hypothetical protein